MQEQHWYIFPYCDRNQGVDYTSTERIFILAGLLQKEDRQQ